MADQLLIGQLRSSMNSYSQKSSKNGGSSSLKNQAVLCALVRELCFWEAQPPALEKPSTGHAANSVDKRAAEERKLRDKSKGAGEWRAASDPATGNVYYYHTVTRQTQWEKPDEIRAMERAARQERRRKDRAFFREMEQNLLASLDRGEVMPGVAVVSKQGPPKEPLAPPKVTVKVRTISCMNEQLLAELQKGDNLMPQPLRSSSTAQQPHPHINGLPLVRGISGGTTGPGRPPLPQRRAMASAASRQGSLELSPENSRASGGASVDSDSTLRGIAILDDGASTLSPTTPATTQNREARLQVVDGISSDPLSNMRDSPPADSANGSNASNGSSAANSHVRRNTAGGTIDVKSTMENPDINAMIKCVCAVYRAHIMQSELAARTKQPIPTSVRTANVNLKIFEDNFEEEGSLRSGRSRRNGAPPLPSLADIELFYQDFYMRSQMEHDTIIMSLIYVERLVKETNGVLTPSSSNWRSVLFSCMVLSSKVWDDLSMFNLDFSNVSIASGLSAFSLRRTNALELAVLTSLNFIVRVPASEYAKYYFLIRTMLTRSGLLDGENLPVKKDDAKIWESRSSHYQNSKLKGQRSRRTQSVDFQFLGHQMTPEPVLREKACLEQLVSMEYR